MIRSIYKRILPKIVRRSIRKTINFLSREIPHRIDFNAKLRSETPVLVYQMGKVGSTSVQRSIAESHTGSVLHAHRLHAEHESWEMRCLFRWAVVQKRPIDLISLTREPIGRNISEFFENLDVYTGLPHSEIDLPISRQIDLFMSRHNSDVPLTWFDKNIKKHFEIDVFATPFPDRGFEIYSHGNVRLLVMRCELDNSKKEEILKNFLDLPDLKIIDQNVSSKKEYAETYREFKDQIVLPLSYIEKMCKSKYFNHFYDQSTISAVRQKWIGRLDLDV